MNQLTFCPFEAAITTESTTTRAYVHLLRSHILSKLAKSGEAKTERKKQPPYFTQIIQQHAAAAVSAQVNKI